MEIEFFNPNNLLCLPNGDEHEHDTTRFKLTCYYNYKKNGTPWTYTEKATMKHRHFHDSIDWILIAEGKRQTREDIAYSKLKHHIKLYEKNIDCALLWWNCHEVGKQFLIGKYFTHSYQKNKEAEPLFIEYRSGHIYIERLHSNPLPIRKNVYFAAIRQIKTPVRKFEQITI